MNAETTLRQIRKSTRVAITGHPMKAFFDENSVSLFVAGQTHRGARVIITLEADDTYTVTAGTVKTVDYVPTFTQRYEQTDVHAEQLDDAVWAAAQTLPQPR